MSAVVDDGAVVAVAVGAAAAVVVAAAAVAIAGELALGDLRDCRLDQIASTFFVVSCLKTTQSDLKSFALSE